MEFCSCASGCQWCGIIHYHWWTASIKPRLLFSSYASWRLSLSSVYTYCWFFSLLFNYNECIKSKVMFMLIFTTIIIALNRLSELLNRREVSCLLPFCISNVHSITSFRSWYCNSVIEHICFYNKCSLFVILSVWINVG